jgi:hypothetical protein
MQQIQLEKKEMHCHASSITIFAKRGNNYYDDELMNRPHLYRYNTRLTIVLAIHNSCTLFTTYHLLIKCPFPSPVHPCYPTAQPHSIVPHKQMNANNVNQIGNNPIYL